MGTFEEANAELVAVVAIIKAFVSSKQRVTDDLYDQLLTLESKGVSVTKAIKDIKEDAILNSYRAYVLERMVNARILFCKRVPKGLSVKERKSFDQGKRDALEIYRSFFSTKTVQDVIEELGTIEYLGAVISQEGVALVRPGSQKSIDCAESKHGYHSLCDVIADYFYQLNCSLTQKIAREMWTT